MRTPRPRPPNLALPSAGACAIVTLLPAGVTNTVAMHLWWRGYTCCYSLLLLFLSLVMIDLFNTDSISKLTKRNEGRIHLAGIYTSISCAFQAPCVRTATLYAHVRLPPQLSPTNTRGSSCVRYVPVLPNGCRELIF